jgi:hypothetical protein
LSEIVVWAADIGSVANNKFGWCRSDSEDDFKLGRDIIAFAKGISDDITNGRKVALGFECPLFVPVTKNPIGLTSKRDGEGNRPWSASAGTCVLAAGLTECVWVFEQIRDMTKVKINSTFDWNQFIKEEANLFIWEAFVSGKAKGVSDKEDARFAANTFWDRYPNIFSDVFAENPYSLVGAALLRAGLSEDLKLLFQQCIVIKS